MTKEIEYSVGVRFEATDELFDMIESFDLETSNLDKIFTKNLKSAIEKNLPELTPPDKKQFMDLLENALQDSSFLARLKRVLPIPIPQIDSDHLNNR